MTDLVTRFSIIIYKFTYTILNDVNTLCKEKEQNKRENVQPKISSTVSK